MLRLVVFAVQRVRLEQQVIKRQIKQGLHFFAAPVMADGVSLVIEIISIYKVLRLAVIYRD